MRVIIVSTTLAPVPPGRAQAVSTIVSAITFADTLGPGPRSPSAVVIKASSLIVNCSAGIGLGAMKYTP
jgi:hypothetical protein